MKKRILSLVLVVAMVAGLFAGLTISASAADAAFYTLTPVKGSNNSYAGNCDITIGSITWNLTGNSQMLPWRLGGKSITKTDRAVYSKTAMGSAISKIELDTGAKTATVNSLKLIVASDASFANVIDTVNATYAANSTITFTPTSGSAWATGAYYKFIFNVTCGGSNQYAELAAARFFAAGGTTPVDPTESSSEPPINPPAGNGKYVKVTSAPADGQYLIVCEDQNVAFNGGLATLDAVSNTVAVSPANGEIAASADLAAAEFTFTASNGSFKSTSGKYIGRSDNSNGLDTDTTAKTNTVTISGGDASIKGAGGAYLRYNADSGQTRFRYFKSSTYTAQKAIQLYVWVAGTTPVDPTEPTEPTGDCEHLNAEPCDAIPATCTTVGYTAGTYCPDCDSYPTGHEATELAPHTLAYDGNGAVKGFHTLACANCDHTEQQACTVVEGFCSVCGAAEYKMPNYTLVTNASTLHAGDHILIVGVESGTYYALAPYVSPNNNCRRNEVSAPVADVITTDVADITLGGAAGAWTLYDGTYYLYAAGGTSDKNNYLKGAANADNNNAKWTIACAADGKATIVTIDSSVVKNTMRHNTGSDLFSCYSGGQDDVYIYMKERPACQHLNVTPITAAAATCTEDGYTANGTYCPDCYTYFDTEVIEKLGHAWDEGVQTAAPTCQTVGTMTFTCTREGCGVTRTEDIATVGHALQWNEIVGANGFHTLACAFDCGYTEQAACTFDGATHLCTVCGAAAPACNITYSVPTNLEAPAAAEGVYNVTLPELPEADGYTAVGWSVTAIPAGGTGNAPEVMEAGAEYQPLSDVTLYAVYSQTVGATGETTLAKMAAGDTIADGDRIVITATYDNEDVTYGLYRETVNTSYVQKYEFDGTVANVLADEKKYVTAVASGDGFILGIYSSSNNLYAGDTTEQVWTLSDLNDGTFKLQSDGRNLSYRGDLSTKYWRMGGANSGTSGQTVLELYKIVTNDGTTTYYTNFEASIHVCAENLTEHVATTPTCTEPGNSLYYECSCGKLYSDATAETLLDAIPAIAATGHDYLYESNEDGTHNVTCTRCDDSASNVACVGELTEDGGTEMECSLCGYTWEVERFYQTSEIAEGDRIIIANGTKAIGSAASGSKLAAIDIVPANATLVPPEGVAILTVTDLAEGQFHLVAADGKYLTYPATGNGLSLADAPAVGATDYALWTIDGSVFKCVNAFYNNNQQALEYYTTFTTYGAGTGAAFQMTIFSDRQGCAHENKETVGAVAATCITAGYSGDLVCTDCETVITAGAEIAPLGHTFVEGACACGATQLTAVKVTSLTDGETIYIFNSTSNYALSATAAKEAGYLAGVPSTAADDVLTTSSDAALFTVHVVSGGYKFEAPNGQFLTYGDDRSTLTLAADSNHAIWAIDADYHVTSVNSAYTFNSAPSVLYLQTYTGKYGFSAYNTSPLNGNYVIEFYDPDKTVCNHVWGEGVEDPVHTCVDAGVLTYTCSECGETKTEVVPADGVHHYDEITHICSGCGQVDPASIDLSGNYYIAGTKATGEIYYMSAEGTADYRQADLQVDLSEIPASIDADLNENYVWTLTKNAQNNTYTIKATYVDGDKYIGWTSGNNAQFVSAENAKALTVTQKNGITNINFAVDETNTRYFSFNAGSPRFAFYANTSQRPDLVLIPVAAEPVTETHTAVPTEAVAATCVAAGNVAYYTCQECATAGEGEHFGKYYSDAALTEEIADVTLPIDGDNHVGYVAGNVIAPTCTEQGYTVYTCSCGETENRDFVDALGHDLAWDGVEGDGQHTLACSRCEYTENEACNTNGTDGACSVCGYKEGPTYILDTNLTATAAVVASSEIYATFTVLPATISSFESFYLEVSKDVAGGEPVVKTFGSGEGMEPFEALIVSNKVRGYSANYTGVYAKELGDSFTATLYAVDANGDIHYNEVYSNSIKGYVLNQMDTTPAFVPFGVAILNYGAAAQVYFGYDTEHLVNESLTPEQKIVPIPEATAESSVVGSINGTVLPGVVLENKVNLTITFRLDTNAYNNLESYDDFKMVIKDSSGNEVARMPVSVGRKTTSAIFILSEFAEFRAKQMHDSFSFTLYRGDTAISNTLNWSVEAYVKECRNTEKETITNAMLVYGNEAAEYFG